MDYEYKEIYRILSPFTIMKFFDTICFSDKYFIPSEEDFGRLNHIVSEANQVVVYISADNGIELCFPEGEKPGEEHFKFAKFCQKQLGKIPRGLRLEDLSKVSL